MQWTIDPAHSMIEFRVKHMMFTTVRGQFGSFRGTLDVNPDRPEQSHVEGSVDIESIKTGDADRDNHLRSADFFDAESHPQMSFRSTRIEAKGDNEYRVHGDLTIRGVTRSVRWDVEAAELGKDPWGNQRMGFSAETRINRKDFGLTWNVALETGGVLVSEDVKILAEVQAVRSSQEAEETAEKEMESSSS